MPTLLSVLTEPYDCLLAICEIATDLALLLQALRTGTAKTPDDSAAAPFVENALAKVRFDSRQTSLHAASQPDSMLLIEQVSMQKTVQAEGTGVVYEVPGWVGPQSTEADSQTPPKAEQPWGKLQEQSLKQLKKPKTVNNQVVCQSRQTWWPNDMLRAAVDVQGSTDIYKPILHLTADRNQIPGDMSAVYSGWGSPVLHREGHHSCHCCAHHLQLATAHHCGLFRSKHRCNIFAAQGHHPWFCASKLLHMCTVLTLPLFGHPQ